MRKFGYKAFISYSHADEKWAKWLVQTLEAYRVPKHIKKARHPNAKKTLGVIVRDREGLSAGPCMDSKIRGALENSEFLIVVCSPKAAKSARVNQEIREFSQLHTDNQILCAIVDGRPRALDRNLDPSLECFPPALQDVSRTVTGEAKEPFAVDLRPGGDGKRMARLKLAATLLSIDLNDLVRRDLQRRNRNLLSALTASLSIIVLFGFLALLATISRSQALTAQKKAQLLHEEAEGLIEYMLVDLIGDQLQSVGKTSVLNSVADRIQAYHSRQSLDELDHNAIGRRARSSSQLARIYIRRGAYTDALTHASSAYLSTKAMIANCPDDVTCLAAHEQTTMWLGITYDRNNMFSRALEVQREFQRTAAKLVELDPSNPYWRTSLANSYVHVGGTLLDPLSRKNEAIFQFQKGLDIRLEQARETPNNIHVMNNLAGAYFHLSKAQYYSGRLEAALQNRRKALAISRSIWQRDYENKREFRNYLKTVYWLAQTERFTGNIMDAETHLNEALTGFAQLMEYDPENRNLQILSHQATLELAELCLMNDEYGKAENLLAQTPPFPNPLKPTTSSTERWLYQWHRLVQASINFRRGNLSEAVTPLEEIVADYKLQQQVKPLKLMQREIYAQSLALLATLQADGKAEGQSQLSWNTILAHFTGDQSPRINAAKWRAYMATGEPIKAQELAQKWEQGGTVLPLKPLNAYLLANCAN